MSSLKHQSPGPEESGADKLYFSYGSNMHLQQMAARCSDSRLFAKGILRSYKWQINSRGGANVIEGNPEDFVEGIVFTVSPSDIQALRHYENVERKFYAERQFEIEVEHIRDTALEGRTPADAAGILASYNAESRLTEKEPSVDAASPGHNHTASNGAVEDTHLQISPEHSTTSHQSDSEPRLKRSHEKPSASKAEEPGSVPISEEGEKLSRKALIYISYEYPLPGTIRNEYINRMRLAMVDALKLGVSQTYLETSLHPLVFGKDPRTSTQPEEDR
ncbi:hypothetical protein JMJ35_005046 [Cladonia borealis]|uniref:gamma-glutamylcyclotransferase n=1 Tax=Cladonia borealis TaxID=184061 RepID=A0AA39V5U7_9LECA|nr:hypothetical protein JMJ35_005046 [Cladonia borealis]